MLAGKSNGDRIYDRAGGSTSECACCAELEYRTATELWIDQIPGKPLTQQ